MKVTIAGYNIESEVLDEFKKYRSQQLTPEVISAAYARISRDPRSVSVLRREAREEVERARRSNERIVFGMGHSSIAEHVVFNIDVIGISRLAVEALEHFRLVSFTEKSQRYIRLGRDVVVPHEIEKAGKKKVFLEAVSSLHRCYASIYNKLLHAGFDNGVAKEDARYVMPLATSAQLGMTVNARELEYMISRLSAHPLAEVRTLASRLQKKAAWIAPSLIRYPEPTEYSWNIFRAKQAIEERFAGKPVRGVGKKGLDEDVVRLVDYTRGGDRKCAATILFSSGRASMEKCLQLCRTMSRRELMRLVAESFTGIEAHDQVWREFENISLTFEIVLSASSYAQLKRHRMATIIPQDYNTELGTSIPDSVLKAGVERDFKKAVEISEKLFAVLSKNVPDAAQYILLNAHRRRVLFHCNMREMYHFSRLRSDIHAQWEIRMISDRMCELARKAFPVSSSLLGGKDKFEAVRKDLRKYFK